MGGYIPVLLEQHASISGPSLVLVNAKKQLPDRHIPKSHQLEVAQQLNQSLIATIIDSALKTHFSVAAFKQFAHYRKFN